MTNADKPNFFTATDRPFRELNAQRDGLLWSAVDTLDRGHVYRDGCFHVCFFVFYFFFCFVKKFLVGNGKTYSLE